MKRIQSIDKSGKITTVKEPSIKTLERWHSKGGCETPCGCWVEPDGSCEHGQDSWLLIMGMI